MDTRYFKLIDILIITVVFVSSTNGHAILTTAQLFENNNTIATAIPNSSYCETKPDSWKCCTSFDKFLPKQFNVCVLLAYIKKDYGTLMEVTINNFILVKQEISLKNPPAICVSTPIKYLKELLEGCVAFYNMTYEKEFVSGCVKLYGELVFVKLLEFPLGCFKIPLATDKDNGTVLTKNLKFNEIEVILMQDKA